MYEEVDMREKGRNKEIPLIAENHVAESVNASPRNTHHCKEDSAKAVCWFFQGGKTTPDNTIVKAERRQERAKYGYEVCGNQVHRASEHPKTEDVCSQVPDVGMRKGIEKVWNHDGKTIVHRTIKSGEAVLRKKEIRPHQRDTYKYFDYLFFHI